MSTEKMFKIGMVVLLFGTPVVFAGTQHSSQQEIPSQDGSSNELQVIVEGGASYGNIQVIGKACIIMNSKQLKKKRVGKGDIIVAPAIHSTWYPELMDVSAIIIEKGDDTSHAIALGKKLDIPVIVGASDATKKIIDGQTIICDPVTRNVYHVAYPDPKEVHFDELMLSQKDMIYQSLPERLRQSARIRTRDATVRESDYDVPHETAIDMCTMPNKGSNKMITKTKHLFDSQVESFKDWVKSTKTALIVGRRSPRWVLNWAGCDDFAVDCIPLSFVFFDSDDDDINQVIKSLGTDDNLEYIGLLLEECKKRPTDVNWARFVAHKKNAATIPMPKNINREKLMADPKAYIAVQDSIDAWERKIRIAAGLFGSWIVEKKSHLIS